jgi:hypothetical protein
MDFEPAANTPIDQLSRTARIMLESGFSIGKGNFLVRLLTSSLSDLAILAVCKLKIA